MKRLALTLLLILPTAQTGHAELRSAQEGEIFALLAGNTAIAIETEGTPWRQLFKTDGTTVYYSGSRPGSLGKWRMEGDQYCSLWPPARNWECYDVQINLDTVPHLISWQRKGTKADKALVFSGDRTLGPLPETFQE
jgi:hypothetical protein